MALQIKQIISDYQDHPSQWTIDDWLTCLYNQRLIIGRYVVL
jgi:hypothetical protein